ncbi:MAG: hypothetical protein ACKOJ7_09750 [Betaproteobacteria bacterium]
MNHSAVTPEAGGPLALEAALQAYELDRLSGGALCTAFRDAARHWPGLPPRFFTVLETLLQPLESSALFSEESCAFSRHDLAASLRPWLQAAEVKAPWAARSPAESALGLPPVPTP